MKKSIVISIILLSIFEFNAQIDRINHYVPGTKISYYQNECGNDIPEAEGKLTFCRDSILGVVDHSLGLNSRVVHKIVQNNYSNDLVFITRKGISIEKEDGTWDNMPNIALPNHGLSTTNYEEVDDAVVMSDGKIAMIGYDLGPRLVLYDMNEKSIDFVDIPFDVQLYPRAVCYDLDRDAVWLMGNYSNTNYLYKYENDEMTLEYVLNDGVITTNDKFDLFQYNNDQLYLAGSSGLTVLDIDDDGDTFIEVHHDQSNSGTLLYDYCFDMEIDNDGSLWLGQKEAIGNQGVLLKFDLLEETYDSYVFEHPTNEDFFLSFSTIGQDRNTGIIWLTSENLGGLVSLEIVDDEPIWNHLPTSDFDDLGVPYIYNVDYIHTQGEKTYFCTNSASSSSNQNYEILVLEEGEWSGINDDEEGNISSRMVRRFQGTYADDNGGVWWLNHNDDDLAYLNDENDFMHFPAYDPLSENTACLNQDQNLVLKSEEGFGEFTPPSVVPFAEPALSNTPNAIDAWSNEIWAASTNYTPQHLVRYIDGEVIQEFVLTEVNNHYHFTMTTDKKAVFVKYISGALIVKIFDPVMEEFTELVYPENIGTLREIVPAEEGNFWVVGWNGLLFYNGSDFEYYNADNLGLESAASNGYIANVVLDQDQKLHVMLTGGGYIYTLAPPYDNYEVESIYKISGANGILPLNEAGGSFNNVLALDSEGDYWISRGGGIIELQREIGVPEFNPNDIVGVEELSQNNIDFEMFPNPNRNGQLRIILPEGSGRSTMSLFDLQGKLVAQHAIQKSSEEIDLKNITSGMYMVNIANENYSLSKKLIVE